jgi:hypothetical protein
MSKIQSIKSIVIGGIIITAAGVGAYMVKSIAFEQEKELTLLNAQIIEEKEKITVLEADWSFLTRPSRIQELSREMLSYAPAEADRFLKLDALDSPDDENIIDESLLHIRTIRGVE